MLNEELMLSVQGQTLRDLTRKMLDHCGVSLSEQHTTCFIFCHHTQTMHAALATKLVSQARYTGMGHTFCCL